MHLLHVFNILQEWGVGCRMWVGRGMARTLSRDRLYRVSARDRVSREPLPPHHTHTLPPRVPSPWWILDDTWGRIWANYRLGLARCVRQKDKKQNKKNRNAFSCRQLLFFFSPFFFFFFFLYCFFMLSPYHEGKMTGIMYCKGLFVNWIGKITCVRIVQLHLHGCLEFEHELRYVDYVVFALFLFFFSLSLSLSLSLSHTKNTLQLNNHKTKINIHLWTKH